MKTISAMWMWVGGGLTGIVGALAFGISPAFLLMGACVLVCLLTMYFGMRAMGGQPDTASAPCHSRITVLKPQDTPEVVDATIKR